VSGINACIEERDTDDTIGRDHQLWLELVGSILEGIIVHPNGRRPCLSVIIRGGEENIRISVSLI